MTLPEHALCSVLLAQFGVRQRWGNKGVALLAVAGIAPDWDTASKLVNDRSFWELHHALGHGLLSLAVSAAVLAVLGRFAWGLRPCGVLWGWCLLAGCVHSFTDAIYWWGVQVLWPFSQWELKLDWIEYLDLLVLSLWVGGAICLYRFPGHRVTTAALTWGIFAAYLALRAILPRPTGGLHFVTGGWMYEAPQGTPVLDWW